MVKITNGINIFEVTKGAYEGVYKHQGYTPIEHDATKEQIEKTVNDYNGLKQADADELFCEEILEKPIASWNKDEVKRFAEIKGISLAGTKNANEGKEKIKEFLSK